ncbi:HlyD family efflux transporter periplasmic adaptor subunit [Tissierella carlieri]|jgi:putative membrane fusion protein|uniref:HlyD family efflux transporter periplasmic adaptor subunit n=1 Tax=Tissierella TaxID=41273 RepID=UPI002804F80E|nr:HlyD family efflux transporter periplasmic adaptor subunit [uncultured Tissierella sp.]MDU5083157.1 HlyD family efflux transporter periplasmic adaptor subunit [Bacillota bacterium]
MSYEKREKNRRKRRVFRTATISFVLIYLIFRAVPSLLASNAKTILPEKGTLIEKLSTQGFVIKNETVVRSTSNGDLQTSSTEGQRLSAGVEVASVNSLNDTSSLKEELSQLEESISALEKSEIETKIILNEKEKIIEMKDSLVNELQNAIAAGNFDEIYLLKSQLSLYDEKNKDISFSNTLVGQSIENLKSKRDSINSEIKSNNIKYYSSHGGIISYVLDGYEENYLPKDFENYTYDKLVLKELKDVDIKTKSAITVGEPIYKIIDNFEWYIAMKIEDLKQIEGFEVGNNIKITLEKDKRELKAKIVSINPSDKKGVVVVRLNTMLHDFYNIRFPKVDIIKSKKEGYKIPTKSIVDKDSIKGVYIKDKSGIVKFRPIIIIGEDDNYTYVDTGDNSGNITIEGEKQPVKTITLFDEIFLNTINIKEGQILN